MHILRTNYMAKPKPQPAQATQATQTAEKATASAANDSGATATADAGADSESDDSDYDPQTKDDASEPSDDEPDYSAITTDVSQVRTRGQRHVETGARSAAGSLAKDELRIDVDAVFAQLQRGGDDAWRSLVAQADPPSQAEPVAAPLALLAEEQVRITISYTFAGKLVRELKLVDANLAEAKAYMNLTNLRPDEGESGPRKSYVTVLRTIPGTTEPVPLRIKLKRPLLVDKFLAGDRKSKLTTLEKSRLDWASFVDKKRLKDDLALHNKAGYLDKQDFLGRVEAKKDMHYQQAKEAERQRQWQQQQAR